jgi:excisionase family DNA binding protein
MGKARKYAMGTGAVTIPEAAAILGISKHTMRARVSDGTIPSFTIGKLRRISRKALDRVMEGSGNERNGETG